MEDITQKYQRLSEREHVLKVPGMYIGGTKQIEADLWVLDKNKIIYKNVSYIPGLYKLFDEIVVNAYDQTIRDDTVTNIKVGINQADNTMSIFNDGKGIDVVMHPKEKMWVPELIFGSLRSSTAFDASKVRITGGLHGLGAKLTAIFSTYFKVEVGDGKRGKQFSQIYTKNLSVRSKPKVTSYSGKGFVKITFKPDLKYFKVDKLSDDMISLMQRRVYDIAALTPQYVSVSLDGNKVEVNNFNQYVGMYTKGKQVSEYCDTTHPLYKPNRWKIIVTPSDGEYKQVSFVNSIYTSNGGKHVDHILNQILKQLNAYVQKKYKGVRLRDTFLKDQMWIFVSSVIENPSFSSQTKEEMVTPIKDFGSVCQLSPGFIKKVIKKLELDDAIRMQIESKQIKELTKMETKKRSQIRGVKKLDDANFAGTAKSKRCTLILTEGDSAKTMAVSGLSAIPKGRDFYGVFPLRGKLLNVREASHSQIMNNEEFKNLRKIIGLQLGKEYTKDNIKELRYGSIILMMDADVDGSHIKGLFINMIDHYFPSLLKINGFIRFLVTPVVKVSKGKEQISFYNLTDYENWREQKARPDLWKIKYYKGLGTSTKEEAKEYFSQIDKHTLELRWSGDRDKDAISLAFSKKRADERKKWLKKYDRDKTIDASKSSITYHDFINKELIHFSTYDNIRSLPNLVDGMKPSQRKVIYSCFKRDLKNEIKVAQFVGYVSEHTSYHHGEMSLASTIIGMAQTFVGSNNINILSPKGQFGSRLQGGKDHSSPRYIFTKLEDITRKLFISDDDALLTYLDDDGDSIEPEYYVPIIPMILVNGADGIGTGYSTSIPKYSPKEIINNLKNLIKKERIIKMKPHYDGFTGKIIDIGKGTYITKGIYEKVSDDTIHITELPVGMWTETYKNFLEALIDAKVLKSIKNNSTESTIDFLVRFKEAYHLTNMEKMKDGILNGLEKAMKLSSKININNMHLFDHDLVIRKYSSPEKIIQAFYDVRFNYYVKRKEYLLKKLKKEIDILESKIKFIDLIISKKLVLFNKKKADIIKMLEKQNLLKLPDEPPFDYLIRMSFYAFTQDKIEELRKKLKEKKAIYDKLRKTSEEQLYFNDLEVIEKILMIN